VAAGKDGKGRRGDGLGLVVESPGRQVVQRPSERNSGSIAGMDEETRTAWALVEEAVDWLRANYGRFEFWVERDLVWTLQTRLRTVITECGLPFIVLNDYPMLPGPRRSLRPAGPSRRRRGLGPAQA
jgi:hypothetical protein